MQDVDVKDKEDWAKIDAEFAMDNGGRGPSFKFGARANEHSRESNTAIGQGPLVFDNSAYPTDVRQLSVGLQLHGRRFPEGHLAVVDRSAAGLQRCRREPRPGRPPQLRGNLPGRGEERRRLRAGRFQGLQLERQHRRALRAERRRMSSTSSSAGATDPDAILGSAFGVFKPVRTTTTPTTTCCPAPT